MRIKRFTIAVILVVFCLLVPFGAGASPGRIASLNLDTDTFWMIGLDETLFLLNPAILAELRPQVWLELTNPVAGGIILTPAKNLNITLITGMPLDFTDFAIPADGINVTQEQIRLGASLALGQLELGVTAMYTGTGFTDTSAATQKDSNMVFDLGAGAIIIINPSTLNIDVAGDVKIWSLHREDPVSTVTEDTTAFDFMALGRLNWVMVPNNEFHIFALFGLFDRSYTPPPAARVKNVITAFRAGFSDEINFTENIMAFAGGLFTMGIVSTDANDITTLDMNGNAGVEVWIIKEMAVRAGVHHNFWHNVANRANSTNATTEAAGATTIQCGTAVRLGDFLVDIHLDKDLVTNGPDFISGSGVPMSLTFTVTYYLGPSAGLLK